MARQYSHRQFFRQVPKALIGRYFQEKRNVLKEIAFDQLKNKQSGRPQKSTGSISQQLNSDHLARQHGQSQLNKSRSWENQRQVNRDTLNRGGGQWGSRMGGRRR